MKFLSLSFLALIALNYSNVNAACDPSAMNIINQCVKDSVKARIDSCGANDLACKCEGYKYIAACFQNCADDSSVKQQASSYNGLKENVCTSAQLVKDGEDQKKSSSKDTSATESATDSSNSVKESGKPGSKASSASGNKSGAGSSATTSNLSALIFVAGAAIASL